MNAPRSAFLLLLGIAACGETGEPTPGMPPRPASQRALRDVAAAAVTRLEAEVGPLVEAPAGPADLEEHVQGLIETLASSDSALGRLAREELAGLAPASVPVLCRWLDDSELPTAQRTVAIEALGASDTRLAAERLLARIEAMRTRKNDEAWVRAHCAWRLGQGSQDWIVPRMIRHLRYENDHETVIWMARALARFGNLSGLDALYVIRGSARTQELRDSANLALYELARERGFEESDALGRAWAEGDSRLPDPALSGLRQLEVWRVIAGFAEWQLRGVDDGRFTLSRENPATALLLAQALEDENRYVRTHAAQSLQRMGRRASAAGPALLAALDDPQAGIFVAEALGGIGCAAAESELIARLEPGYPLELRTAAARGLALLALGTSSAALERFSAGDAPRDLRIAAACARLRCSPADAPRALVELVRADYSTGTGETAASEAALAAWLAAQDVERAGELQRAWSADLPSEPGERRAARVALIERALALQP